MTARHQEINEKAAEWVAKTALRTLTAAEQAELDAWLAADIRHLGAFTRAKAILARVDRLPSASVDEICEDEGAPDVVRRRLVLTGSVAAGIAAISLFAVSRSKSPKPAATPALPVVATAKGQTREILLADGSVITLNTNSKVSYELTAKARNIHLLQGEALFDVAKDRERPFVVYARETQVRAVGTSFSVSVLAKKPLQVVVREGVVELKRAKTASVWVSANTRVIAHSDEPIVAEPVTSTKIAHTMAWQYGRIVLDHETLKDAADEFARYTDVQIVVDPAVADRTITGMFAANDPVAFAKAAATVLGLQFKADTKEVQIYE
jgi:Fe2+-dicitrate sensor, membrane component